MTNQTNPQNERGPRQERDAGRGDDNNCRQFTASIIRSQLAVIEAPASAWWISDDDRQVLRRLINMAVTGFPESGVRIELRDLQDEPERFPWASLDVQIGRVRYIVAVLGWRPIIQVDAQALQADSSRAWQAGAAVDEAREVLLDAQKRHHIPRDYADFALDALNRAERMTGAMADYLESDPARWQNPIPENAWIDGLACFISEAEG